MLKTEPSLSSYCESGDGLKPENPVTGIEERRVGDSVDAGFSFAKHNTDVLFIKEEDSQTEQGDEEVVIKKIDGGRGFEIERPPSPPMHLATGCGIDKFDLYGKEIKFDLPSFDDESCGDYYKRMLDEYPSHPLLLKNYASFLEYKGDLSGAGEYYHKCTVVEPSDGVALTSYGRLVMQLHQDEAKASNYFERAVQASPEDMSQCQEEKTLSLEGAGEHSSRLSETEDGETLCRYAKAFWSIKGDRDKALFYFEKAVEASPKGQMHIILGEYARFLWEIEE
ncbi:hypothetical protein Bca4012_008523 [Brassica carinata]